MSLKEKMAVLRSAKEQKFAERQVASAGKTVEAIVGNLRKDRSQINLLLVEKVAEIIFDAQSKKDNEVMNKLLDSVKYRLMYKAVEEYLSGNWMVDFKNLLQAVPGIFLKQAQVIKVDKWREYAVKAGIDEVGLVQALQVIFIFRKSFDRNQISNHKAAIC